MTQTMRANVVSSFTVIKGALITETYTAFKHWDLSKATNDNLAELKQNNAIGAKSANWLRDVVFVLQRRFDPDGRDRALVTLATIGCPLEVWKPILLWHMTRDEFLLRDFLIKWLYPRFREQAPRLQSDDLLPYLSQLSSQRVEVAGTWSTSTAKRVAAGLLRIAADFGLLKGSAIRQFGVYHLPEPSFLYLLHAMVQEFKNPDKLLDSPDWRMYLMSRADVEQELLRLHQFRKLHYEAAGSRPPATRYCPQLRRHSKRWSGRIKFVREKMAPAFRRRPRPTGRSNVPD